MSQRLGFTWTVTSQRQNEAKRSKERFYDTASLRGFYELVRFTK